MPLNMRHIYEYIYRQFIHLSTPEAASLTDHRIHRTATITTPLPPPPRSHRPTSGLTLDTPRLYRVSDAMRMLSLSRSVIYELIRAGRLRSVTQGRTRLIPSSAITDYIALLEEEAQNS
ncbi:helix-turn-helix domain-containing protein [Sphaerisporangium sp. NPDC005288]|uniref:helix-turn-helix domain-containing protein n=1 Tax=Sphaerisporangium sp. NPDC005288 TaxID=3155114 RepID=UPI0033A349AC